MKILITHEIFPPQKTGGGEDVMLGLAKDLKKKKRGHEVRVLTSGNPDEKIFEGVPIKRFNVNRYFMNLFEKQVEDAAKDFDIIQTSSGNLCYPSWRAAKKLGKPVVCIVHHAFGKNWRDVRGPVVGRIFQRAEKFFLSRDFDRVVVQNRNTEKLVRAINTKSKIVFLPSGLRNFAQLTPAKKEKYVLFVGSHDTTEQIANVKGIKYLLEAAKKNPEVKFVIAGGGNYLEKLEAHAPRNVDFIGYKTGGPLFNLYRHALVFCLPSLAEGFSRATAEAMAAGCAVVSTIDLGQAGKIIEPKSSEQIAGRIKFYFENPSIAKADGRKNSIVARRLSWKKFIDGIEKIYSEAITERLHKS